MLSKNCFSSYIYGAITKRDDPKQNSKLNIWILLKLILTFWCSVKLLCCYIRLMAMLPCHLPRWINVSHCIAVYQKKFQICKSKTSFKCLIDQLGRVNSSELLEIPFMSQLPFANAKNIPGLKWKENY